MDRDGAIVRDVRTGELYEVISREVDGIVARGIRENDVRFFQEGQSVPHSPGLIFVGQAVQTVLFADYSKFKRIRPILIAGFAAALTATTFAWFEGMRGWSLLGIYTGCGVVGSVAGAGWKAHKGRSARR